MILTVNKKLWSLFYRYLVSIFRKLQSLGLTPIGMREDTFHFFELDFAHWIYIRNFKTFLEVKIDINRIN